MTDSKTQAEVYHFVRGVDAALKEYENAIRYNSDPRARISVLRAKAEQTMFNLPQDGGARILTEQEARDVQAIRGVLSIFGGNHAITGFERLVATLLNTTPAPQGGGGVF